LTLVIGACAAGHSVIEGIAKSLEIAHWVHSLNPVKQVEHFCEIGIDSVTAVYVTGIGSILCVIGEVLLLVAVTHTYVRLAYAFDDQDEQAEKDAIFFSKLKNQQEYGSA